MTMSFFSISGYEHLRNYLKDEIKLPHVRTIRQWYSNTSGGPGMTAQAIEEIRKKIHNESKTLYFSLMMDEIANKKHKDWDQKHKEFVGFVD